MTFFFGKGSCINHFCTPTPPLQLHNVLALSYEWMDIQTVTHHPLLSFYLHFITPSPPFLFFFLAEMMTSVSFGWKQSGE